MLLAPPAWPPRRHERASSPRAREDAAGVEPARALLAEDRAPSRCPRACSCDAAVWPRSEQPTRRAHAEAALGEVEAVAHGAADAVVLAPTHDATGRRRPGRSGPATSRPTGLSANAVTMAVRRPKQRFRPRATLYSPPPSQAWKRARRVDAALAGIEAQHHLAEADEVEAAVRRGLDLEGHGAPGDDEACAQRAWLGDGIAPGAGVSMERRVRSATSMASPYE